MKRLLMSIIGFVSLKCLPRGSNSDKLDFYDTYKFEVKFHGKVYKRRVIGGAKSYNFNYKQLRKNAAKISRGYIPAYIA